MTHVPSANSRDKHVLEHTQDCSDKRLWRICVELPKVNEWWLWSNTDRSTTRKKQHIISVECLEQPQSDATSHWKIEAKLLQICHWQASLNICCLWLSHHNVIICQVKASPHSNSLYFCWSRQLNQITQPTLRSVFYLFFTMSWFQTQRHNQHLLSRDHFPLCDQ